MILLVVLSAAGGASAIVTGLMLLTGAPDTAACRRRARVTAAAPLAGERRRCSSTSHARDGAVPAVGLAACVVVGVAERGISWTTVILVGGMIALSTAMVESGAAAQLADALVDVVGDHGPHALLLGVVLLTFALGQLISNMATALIVIPVAVSAAADMDVSAKPVLMALAVAAAASFLTPVATPANLMVMGPGGYRFGDYWKLGLPLLALFGVVAVLLVPVVWSF